MCYRSSLRHDSDIYFIFSISKLISDSKNCSEREHKICVLVSSFIDELILRSFLHKGLPVVNPFCLYHYKPSRS